MKPPGRVAQFPPPLARKQKTIVYSMLFHAEHAKPGPPPRLNKRQSISPPSSRPASRPSYRRTRRPSNGTPSQPATEAPKSKCQTLLGTMENNDFSPECVQTRRETTKSRCPTSTIPGSETKNHRIHDAFSCRARQTKLPATSGQPPIDIPAKHPNRQATELPNNTKGIQRETEPAINRSVKK